MHFEKVIFDTMIRNYEIVLQTYFYSIRIFIYKEFVLYPPCVNSDDPKKQKENRYPMLLVYNIDNKIPYYMIK